MLWWVSRNEEAVRGGTMSRLASAVRPRLTQRALLRRWQTGLLATPLTVLALLAALTLGTRPPRNASGDPLLDQLLLAVDAPAAEPGSSALLNALRDPSFSRPAIRLRLLPDGVDETLAHDPRYWLALSWGGSGYLGDEAGQGMLQRGLAPGVWCLEEARRRQCADADVMIWLLHGYRQQWSKLEQPVANNPADPLEKKWPRRYWKCSAQAFNAAAGPELDQLLHELLELGRTRAAAYYLAASLEARRGNLQLADDLVRMGNALPLDSGLPSAAPVVAGSMVLSQQQRSMLGLQLLLAGAGDPVASTRNDLIRRCAADAAGRGDCAALTDLHRCAVRCAMARPEDVLLQFASIIQMRTVVDALRDLSPRPLTAEEQQRLAQASSLHQQLIAAIQQHRKGRSQVDPPWKESLFKACDLLSAGAFQARRSLSTELAEQRAQRELYYRQLAPLWKQLEHFDYQALDAAVAGPSSP
jgi:hypothetical protein